MEVILSLGGFAVFVFGSKALLKLLYDGRRRSRLLEKYGDEAVADAIMRRLVWEGMSREQLIDSWGQPIDIGNRVTKTKTVETFKYGKIGRRRYSSRVTVEDGNVVGWDQK